MKFFLRILATVVCLVFLFIAVLSAAQNPTSNAAASNTLTIWQARRTVAATDPTMGEGPWKERHWGPDPRSFRFTPDTFEFVASRPAVKNEHFTVDLRKLDEVGAKCHTPWQNSNRWCSLANAQGKGLSKNGSGGLWYIYYEHWHEGGDRYSACSANCVASAHAFAAAINRLRNFANDAESPLRTFTQRAAAWQALPTKPPLPEDIRLQRMLAEDAVKQKNPGEALLRYETGLELYPTWPQGWFNAALIAAELGYYTDAVEHMQAYLELVPDAPDTQAARDQIAMWQFRAKQSR